MELGIVRNGNPDSVTVTLAELLPSVVLTPSAEITVSDNTILVIDIGFNGVTGVLVLDDQAHLREPVTGSEIDVSAGSAVIVAPGYAIGSPIQIAAEQTNRWWETPPQQPVAAPESPPPSSSPLIWVIGLCLLAVAGVTVFLVMRRHQQQPVPLPPPPRT